MEDAPQEMTQEQYKIQVLKQRIGEMAANYEEIIANQATTLAALRSELNFYKETDKLHAEGAPANALTKEEFEAQQADGLS